MLNYGNDEHGYIKENILFWKRELFHAVKNDLDYLLDTCITNIYEWNKELDNHRARR